MGIVRNEGDGAMAPQGRKWGYAAIAVVLLVGVMGAIGWKWRSEVTLNRIEVVNACEEGWKLFSSKACPDLNTTQAEIADQLQDLMGSPLYDLNTVEVTGRVARHPWIKEVWMERTQSGTMTLTVSERTPVLLAMRRGRPAYLFDAEGYRMPIVKGVAYDVPLLHGVTEEYDALKPVSEPSVRELAAVLADLDPSIQALVSEIELRKARDIVFHTTILDNRGSIEVRMGRRDIREQLVKLHAFWHQALLPDPALDVRQIDLRFDSQIVTR